MARLEIGSTEVVDCKVFAWIAGSVSRFFITMERRTKIERERKE